MEVEKSDENFCALCYLPTSCSENQETGNIKEDAYQLNHVLEEDSLCSRCRPVITSAITTKGNLEETEKTVRRLQLELLKELGKLEGQVNSFKMLMDSVDQLVEVPEQDTLDKVYQNWLAGDNYYRRRTEFVQSREKALEVVEDLQTFHELITFNLVVAVQKPDAGRKTRMRRPGPRSKMTSGHVRKTFVGEKDNSNDKPSNNSVAIPPPPPGGQVKEEFKEDYNFDVKPIAVYSSPSSMESETEKDKPEINPTSPPSPSMSLFDDQEETDDDSETVKPEVGQKGDQSLKKCEICGKMDTARQLLIHKRIHTGETPYKCKFCKDKFHKWTLLASHLRRTHGKRNFDPELDCQICGKSIKRANMEKHLWRHNSESSFECDFCGRGFSEKDVLESHRRLHTGETPYKCEICGKGYGNRGSLFYHRKRAHVDGKTTSGHKKKLKSKN